MEHIEKDVGNNNSLHHHADVGISPSATTTAAAAAAQTQFFRKDVPHFLDQTFRMIENAPDQVVCWSQAGDSFIIRQVVSFEGLLPYYYNHNKFMSFVRQLNFYGFKKVKAGAAAAAPAAAPAGELGSWQEFSHPQFQRGRRDLLAGIKRQKDKGRSKRKQDEVHKSSMLSDLSKKLDVMSDELRAVNGKLDDTMSLLLVQQNQNLLKSQNEGRGGGGGGGGGAGRGSGTGSSVTSFDDDGLPAKFHGAPHIYMPPRPPFDQRGHQQHQHQQEQGWPGHQFYPQPYQQPPPTDQYPVTPYEVSQERRSLPPLAAAVAARASEASRGGSAGHHLPPLLLPPSAPAIYKQSDGHESSSTLHPPK